MSSESLKERLRQWPKTSLNLGAEAEALLAEALARIQALEGERSALKAALNWIEPPFVDESTSEDELRTRVWLAVKDGRRASELYQTIEGRGVACAVSAAQGTTALGSESQHSAGKSEP